MRYLNNSLYGGGLICLAMVSESHHKIKEIVDTAIKEIKDQQCRWCLPHPTIENAYVIIQGYLVSVADWKFKSIIIMPSMPASGY